MDGSGLESPELSRPTQNDIIMRADLGQAGPRLHGKKQKTIASKDLLNVQCAKFSLILSFLVDGGLIYCP